MSAFRKLSGFQADIHPGHAKCYQVVESINSSMLACELAGFPTTSASNQGIGRPAGLWQSLLNALPVSTQLAQLIVGGAILCTNFDREKRHAAQRVTACRSPCAPQCGLDGAMEHGEGFIRSRPACDARAGVKGRLRPRACGPLCGSAHPRAAGTGQRPGWQQPGCRWAGQQCGLRPPGGHGSRGFAAPRQWHCAAG